MKKLSAIFVILLSSGLTGVGCSSGEKQTAAPVDGAPAWIHQPARTVEGGYIIYVASSADRSLDQAQFKAQSAAIQDVNNECSFAPKGTRLEDRYNDTLGILSRAYAKVAVSYQDCDEAQKAIDPTEIKKLANVALVEQVKRYQDALDAEVLAADDSDQNPGNNGVNPEIARTSAPPPINDSVQFFVVRQQVAYAKEVVILSPPNAYPPYSVASTNFVQVIRPATTQIQTYRTVNPTTASSPMSWSSLPSKPAVPPLSGMKGVRSSPARLSSTAYGNGRNHSGPYTKTRNSGSSPAKKGKKGKRRRYNDKQGEEQH